MGVSERSNKTRRRTLRAVSAKESAHVDHGSQEALRPLNQPNPRPFTHVGYKRCMLAFLKLASDFRGGVRPGYSRSRILRPTPTPMHVDNGYELRTSFREPLR